MSDHDADSKTGGLSAREVRQTRKTITAVCHDLSNPLSIIGGNAQLLTEMAASLDLREDILDPIRDIERAVEQVAAQLERLTDLNERLSAAAR